MSKIIEQIKNLPQAPGVYFFYAKDKQLLYIGKATNLRSRVSSYFRGVISSTVEKSQKEENENLSTLLRYARDDKKIDDSKKYVDVQGRSEWIGMMVAQVADIAFQQTDSVLEALILESNLIKKHQPKYNTLEKDDKSFAYFVITKEEYPRVIIVRKTDLDKMPKSKLQIPTKKQISNDKLQKKSFKYKDIVIAHSFGPYSSKFQMQIALKIMRRIFPFHALKQKSEKGCLDFQLGVCPGPYDGKISPEDYKKNIRGIRMILEGKKQRLINTLKKEMQAYAKKHEFEKAADTRNKIYALEHIRDVALMTREFEEMNLSHPDLEKKPTIRIEAYDNSNIGGEHAVASMVVFENGKPNKNEYRKFKIKTIVGANDVASMREVLLRRFKNDWLMPDLILLDGGLGHLNMGEKLLHEDLGLAVNLAAVAKGPTRKKLDVRIARNVSEDIKNILENDLLLKSIMDEAHRFAITFHRHRRKKGMLH